MFTSQVFNGKQIVWKITKVRWDIKKYIKPSEKIAQHYFGS